MAAGIGSQSHGRLPLVSGRGKGYAASEAGFNRQHRIDVGHHSEPRAYASPLQRFKSRGHPLVQKLGHGMD